MRTIFYIFVSRLLEGFCVRVWPAENTQEHERVRFLRTVQRTREETPTCMHYHNTRDIKSQSREVYKVVSIQPIHPPKEHFRALLTLITAFFLSLEEQQRGLFCEKKRFRRDCRIHRRGLFRWPPHRFAAKWHFLSCSVLCLYLERKMRKDFVVLVGCLHACDVAFVRNKSNQWTRFGNEFEVSDPRTVPCGHRVDHQSVSLRKDALSVCLYSARTLSTNFVFFGWVGWSEKQKQALNSL